ncbi:MAG: hypothetical protein RLZZ543_1450 [Bacteroidota bacterium]
MTKNARSLFITLTAAFVSSMLVTSCSHNPLSPGVEYAPDMYRGPALEAYGSSNIFSDSLASRKPVAGTIPRFNDETLPFYEPYAYPNTNEGYEAAGLGLSNPIAATPENLEKGKTIYSNFCIHCHGEKGDGMGILVQRDKFAGVPSYFGATLKDLPVGKMYHTIYYGKNMMGSHASQINFNERWQVIRWVEKLRADGLGTSTTTATADTTAAASTTANPTVKK